MIIIDAPQGHVFHNRDGNFSVRKGTAKKVTTPPPEKSTLWLDRQQFARIFGRIPANGVNLRADVFIRLCRLANVVLFFEGGSEDRDVLLNAYNGTPKIPILQTFGENPGHGIFLNDEGNFNLQPFPSVETPVDTWTLFIDSERFECMFGRDSRDFFANEVLRISKLAGHKLRAISK